jgi:hypothetical protein
MVAAYDDFTKDESCRAKGFEGVFLRFHHQQSPRSPATSCKRRFQIFVAPRFAQIAKRHDDLTDARIVLARKQAQ